jgi:iron complex transport system ATP-binding protein
LEDFSLDFFAGRHYVIAGPNGAGKSTILDLLSRLKEPSAGKIEVFGRNVKKYQAGEYARLLALAPQSFAFNFSFTVREIVSLGRRPYLGRWGRLSKEDDLIVDRAISFLNLGRLENKLVTALSGGETQRVVLARTLAQSTPIVLLDEPTASLDVAQAIDLMERVRVLASQGVLVVTVTHDLHLAAIYADHVAFLRGGRLVAAGALAETMTAPILREVFEADARVEEDAFTGGLRLSFKSTRSGNFGKTTPDPDAADEKRNGVPALKEGSPEAEAPNGGPADEKDPGRGQRGGGKLRRE